MPAPKTLVGVFWDIENCSVPKNKSAAGVVNHIRNNFIVNRRNHREYEFLVACDVSKIRKDIIEDLNRAGAVTLAHVSGTNKNAADAKIRESMRRFVDMHALMVAAVPTPPMMVLISGDIDFVHDLRGYQTRLGSTVILIHDNNCCEHFKLGWNEIHAFNEFCLDVPSIDEWLRREAATSMTTEIAAIEFSEQAECESDPDSESSEIACDSDDEPETNSNDETESEQHTTDSEYILMVSGLPGKYNFRVLKAKLQEQAETVNGYVKFVDNGQGFISLKSYEDATAAANLFQGYKIYGKKLKSSFVNRIPFKSGTSKSTEQQEDEPEPDSESTRVEEESEPEIESESEVNQWDYVEEIETEAEEEITTNVEYIMMVSGLPGKQDYRILKGQLQEQANLVNGWVRFVNNGQAFIALNRTEDANAAVAFFQQFQFYGKTLKCTFVNHIPFLPRKGQTIGEQGYPSESED